MLFGSSNAHKQIRQEIIENHKLDAVISMPSGVFKPYAGVSTAILIFTRTDSGGTDNVWFYDMQNDGYTLDDKRNKSDKSDLQDIIKQYHKRTSTASSDKEREGFFFSIAKQEIIENVYDLSFSKFRKEFLKRSDLSGLQSSRWFTIKI